MPKNRVVQTFVIFAVVLMTLLYGLLKPDVTREFDLRDRQIKISDLMDASHGELELDRNSVIYIHTDTCRNCLEDMDLFKKLDLKSQGNIFGVKLREDRVNARIMNDSRIFSKTYKARTSDFFVELGISFVPVTLVVGTDGKILYSHLGKLNIKNITDEIIPLISTK